MSTRALILGGGGPVGIAWEAGVLCALAEAGIDVADSDAIVGTSAGSVVGALLALGQAPEQIAETWGAAPEPSGGQRPEGARRAAPPVLAQLVACMRESMLGTRPAAELAAELGAHAVAAPTIDEARFVEVFAPVAAAARGASWPEHYACTAVDTASGSFEVWDARSGVEIERAVASSCAVPGIFPPITLRGRRYMDGGVHSPTNAQLAAGHAAALVLTVTECFLGPLGRSLATPTSLERESAALREEGTRVEIIGLDAEAARALGAHLMDPAYQPHGLAAGLRQGREAAKRVRALFSATRS